MKYRILGRTGIRVSAIGLGCEGFIGMSETQTRDMIDFAIERGINCIDMYSPNPDMRNHIGKALGERRKQFIIQGHLCTIWENGQYLRTRDPEKTSASFEDLLNRLQTDYLDVGMIHYIDDEKDFHQVFDGPIMQQALRWKSEGRIKHIGMSSHNPHTGMLAIESGLVDVLLFSINPCYDLLPGNEDVELLFSDDSYAKELHNIDPERERLYELCERTGIGINVMKVYAGGDLLDEKRSPFGRAFTPVQSIEYALTRPGVASVMVGCRSLEEIQAALGWCDASREELDYVQIMKGMNRFTWKGHCMYCGHCAPCTMDIDIASINKYYNLTVAEGFIPETVREHYKLLAHHASECIGCGKCEKNCPFGVDIRTYMQKAAEQFGY